MTKKEREQILIALNGAIERAKAEGTTSAEMQRLGKLVNGFYARELLSFDGMVSLRSGL